MSKWTMKEANPTSITRVAAENTTAFAEIKKSGKS